MKTTVILALIAAALLAFVVAIERHQPNTRQAFQLQYPKLSVESAFAIEIARPEGPLVFEKVTGDWMISDPIPDRANPSALTEWLQQIDSLNVIEIIDAVELETAAVNPSELGLTGEDALAVTIKRERDAPIRFLIGATGAFGNSTYLSFPDNEDYPHIYLVEGELRNLAAADVDSLRDTTLFPFPYVAARHASLSDSPNNFSVNRPTPDSSWNIQYPFSSRADDEKVDGFLEPFWSLYAQSVQSDIGAPTPGDHLATLAIEPFADEKGERTTLSIYGPPEGSPLDLLVVKVNTRPHALMMVAREDLPRILDTKADELRDPHPTRIPFREVQHINIKSDSDPEFQLLRSEKDPQFWRLSRHADMRHLEPANVERLGTFLKELDSVETVEYINVSLEQLAEYGFDRPALSLNFIAFGVPKSNDAAKWLSDPSGDSAAVFNLRIGTVLEEDFFGDKEHVFAHFNDEPIISRLDPEFLSLVPTQASRWKGLSIIAFNPIQFRAVSLKTDDDTVTSLTYNFPSNQWQLTRDGEQSEANTESAQSIVKTLSNLQASDWLAAGADAYAALAHPELTVSITLEVPDEQAGGLSEQTTTITLAPVPPAKTHLPAHPRESKFYYGRIGASPDVFLIETSKVKSLLNTFESQTSP